MTRTFKCALIFTVVQAVRLLVVRCARGVAEEQIENVVVGLDRRDCRVAPIQRAAI